eukprot:TRINITY_DN1841_c0_g2_i1.p1 TRINITY_DN1841_c0_g2~~TRINITY_DN1841_c0_g2_i1.p1  ORF type:complete len:115 (-),score=17.26 TRINITY_DN1841_c0_g2_i1:11-355(-)
MYKSKAAPSEPDPNIPVGYEFLDHTADVQIHTWAPTLQTAFEQQVIAMFDYMTEINAIEVDPNLEPLNVFVEGHDLESLLYAFMDEFLFQFSTEGYACNTVSYTHLTLPTILRV